LKAAETAVCGIIQAVDFVMKTNNSKSFVCSRPPGHHAEPDKLWGFVYFQMQLLEQNRLLIHTT